MGVLVRKGIASEKSFCSIIHIRQFSILKQTFSLIDIILKILYSIEYKYGRIKKTPTKCNHQTQAQAVGPLVTTKTLSILGFHHQGLMHLLKNRKASMLQQILFNLGLEVNLNNQIHSNRPIPKKAFRGERMFTI